MDEASTVTTPLQNSEQQSGSKNQNSNLRLVDTSEFPHSIKKILKSLVFKAIEEEINEDNLTKSAANTDRFIFSNIPNMENIYLNIHNSTYFNNIVYFLFFFNLFSLSIVSIFLISTSKINNNAYCFNQRSNNFEICDIVKRADDIEMKYAKILVLNKYKDASLYYSNDLDELSAVQKKFQDYFYYDILTIKSINNEGENYSKTALQFPFNTFIVIDKGEAYNIWIMFKDFYNYHTTQIKMCVSCLIGLIFGSIIFGYLSDLFGRKRILELIMLCQFLGCFCIFLFSSAVVISGHGSRNVKLPSYFERAPDLKEIFAKQTLTTPFFFEMNQSMNKVYLDNFIEINQNIIGNKIISKNFTKYKVFFFYFIFLCSTGISSGFNISLSLMFEECVHERDIFNNYFVLFLSVLLSHPLGYFMLHFTNSFYFTFLILSLAMIFCFIFSILFLYESPRYHFEYCEYDKLTYILMKTCDKKNIKGLFREVHSESVEDEVEKMEKNYYDVITKEDFTFSSHLKYTKNEDDEEELVISRINFFFSFYGFFGLIFKDKNFYKNFNIIFSLIGAASLMYYITIGNFNSILNITRQKSYVPKLTFYVFSLLSNIFFYSMIKFFGYRLNFFIGFIGAFVTSILLVFSENYSNSYEDLNKYYYNNFRVIVDKYETVLYWLLSIEYFFTHGIFFTLFLYLVKFSKTLYRCTFFGIVHLFIDCLFAIMVTLCNLCPYNMIYGIYISLLGIIITFFVHTDTEDNIIVEYRKVDSKKKK